MMTKRNENNKWWLCVRNSRLILYIREMKKIRRKKKSGEKANRRLNEWLNEYRRLHACGANGLVCNAFAWESNGTHWLLGSAQSPHKKKRTEQKKTILKSTISYQREISELVSLQFYYFFHFSFIRRIRSSGAAAFFFRVSVLSNKFTFGGQEVLCVKMNLIWQIGLSTWFPSW